MNALQSASKGCDVQQSRVTSKTNLRQRQACSQHLQHPNVVFLHGPDQSGHDLHLLFHVFEIHDWHGCDSEHVKSTESPAAMSDC
jgi:hypothetical protein